MQNFALLLGIVLAEWVVLYSQTRDSRGYLWRALIRASLFLVPAIVVLWAIAWVFLVLSHLFDSDLFRSNVWAVVIGVIAVMLPSAFERFLNQKATTRIINGTLVQLLLRFHILMGQTLKKTIQQLKQQDNYDCQKSSGWWNFGLPKGQIDRRLRILYETCKLDIACKRRESELLMHDVDIFPGQKFYLLVAHLGRKRLRRELAEQPCSPPPSRDWDGRERRTKKSGTKADRRLPDSNPSYSRVYDDEQLRDKISKGIVIDSTTEDP